MSKLPRKHPLPRSACVGYSGPPPRTQNEANNRGGENEVEIEKAGRDPVSQITGRPNESDPTSPVRPDSTNTYNRLKTAKSSIPSTEPEIEEISPYGPGDGFQSDRQ